MQADSKPVLIEGDLSIDNRGEVRFVNQFDPTEAGVKRVYLTSNHWTGAVRAWHGHRREAKYVMAVGGVALVCAVEVDDWVSPNSSAEVSRFVLSTSKPAVLFIPPGYANGWMSLTADCRLLWFSTATVEESREDDYRFSARYWNSWEVKER
jgi:dTDP-4-dehydrorhamnose 3,5-epimerase-like enzyme